MPSKKLSQEIVFVCRQLHARNLTASADGNVSAKLPDGKILITPAGRNKAFIAPEEIVVLDPDGSSLGGTPSSELLMHLEVYRRCPLAKAVVHAHPPTAIAWTIAQPQLKCLPTEFMSELILAVGEVPIIPFARPGLAAMGENLIPFLPQNRAMILARHGALAWGESLIEAYNGLERIEHSAQILKSAVEIGSVGVQKLIPLSNDDIVWLKQKRKELGEKIL